MCRNRNVWIAAAKSRFHSVDNNTESTCIAAASLGGTKKKKTTCWNNAEVFSSKFCFEFYARYPIHYLPVLTSCWLPCNDFLGAEATGTQRFDELWPTAASVAASLQVQALIYVFQMSVITLSARWLTQRLLSINRNLLSLPFQTFQLPKAIKHLPTAAKQK